MRLNRFISASGFASRRKGEVFIREGRVKVNGETVTDPARDIDTVADRVTLDENVLAVNPEKRYYALNKPTGVISTMSDTHGRATVPDLLREETRGVFPVGRLDADTSGVLLFTDDGDLAHRLIHPSFGVEKTYRAEVRGRVNGEDVRRIAEGIDLDDGPAAPANLFILDSSDETSMVVITLHQGRKRQVRRMFETLGHPVITLERTAFGGITAEGLPPGSYRPLTWEEVERLKKESKVQSPKPEDKAQRHKGTK